MLRVKMLVGIIPFLLFSLFSAPVFAQTVVNPTLSSRALNADGAFISDNRVSLESISISVQTVSAVSQTRMELELRNNSGTDLETELALEMPFGAIVNDYALDINGQLVTGVLVEKERAKKAYTDKVTANIDPGIAEVVAGNIYKTRIFPVPASGRRKIALGFATPVFDQDLNWSLNSKNRLKKILINIDDNDAKQFRDNPAFTANENGAFIASNTPLSTNFMLKARSAKSTITGLPKSSGTYYSSSLTREELAKLAVGKTGSRDKIRIYWDHSLSRRNDNTAAEINIIDMFLKQADPRRLDLVMLRDSITAKEKFTGKEKVSDLRQYIEKVDYDGGSDINAALNADLGAADMCILVSDGHSTLGRSALGTPDCPVYVISGSDNPNSGFFALLAEKTGGQIVPDLSSKERALSILNRPRRAYVADSNLGDTRWIGSLENGFFIGDVNVCQSDLIELIMKTPDGKTVKIHRPKYGATRLHHAGPGTLWAARRIEEMRSDGKPPADIVKFSRRFKIAGPESALLVLEDIDDYIEAEITPPKDFPTSELAEYKKALIEYKREQDEAKMERQDDILEIWTEQIEWWDRTYKWDETKKEIESPDVDSVVATASRRARGDQNVEMAPPPRPAEESSLGELVQDIPSVEFGGEVVADITDEAVGAQIKIRKWMPDRPYIRALSNASDENFETVYKSQREIYGDLPAFYLEVSDLLYAAGQKQRAIDIVLGALELPSSNIETMTVVSHRLLVFGDTGRAIALYRKALGFSKDRPQAYYNLAIALSDHARELSGPRGFSTKLEALKLLDHIIRNVWDGDDDGIELVSLMEANSIIATLSEKELWRVSIDKRLHKNLDVDQRVVMDWNIDFADIDLWITEPSGERAGYSNQLTKIGGQVSNDMTDGYGPEQYVLRTAPSGTYTIESDFFSASEYNPNGATSVRVRITKNFGRPEQETETLIFAFSEENDEDVIIGEFTVE